jgi:YD repeat-containing protein
MWSNFAFVVGTKSRALSRLVTIALIFSVVISPAQPVFAAFGDGTPTIPNASVFNEQSEAPRIDGASGAFTQRIPLDIPPGRNGLQPDVSLQYNSQNTSDSMVGYGWSLSIPYIQRLNKTGSQDLYGNNQYFTSSIDGELAIDASTTNATSNGTSATTTPYIMDSFPLTVHTLGSGSSDNFSYTVPSGGSNKVLVVLDCDNDGAKPTSATQNGVSLATFVKLPGHLDRCNWFYSYLVAPTSGTFQINFPTTNARDYEVFTVQNASQTTPVDTSGVSNAIATSVTESTTTSATNDLLVSMGARVTSVFTTYGSNQTETANKDDHTGLGYLASTWKPASSTAGSISVSGGAGNSVDTDWTVLALQVPPGSAATATTTYYTISATSSPAILDTLPIPLRSSGGTSTTTQYTVPGGGFNQTMIALVSVGDCASAPPTATQNGSSLTFVKVNGSSDRACYFAGYLASPTSGTFQLNFPASETSDFVLMTLRDAAQSNPIDAANVSGGVTSLITTSLTTTSAYDLLLSFPKTTETFGINGANETAFMNVANSSLGYTDGSYKSAASTTGSESMSVNLGNPPADIDEPVIAIKAAVQSSVGYRARVDDGSFNSYTFSNNTWTVYDKKGTRYLYGSDDSGRMYDASTSISNQTSKWYLQEVRDTNGNYIKYTYNRDANEIYPYKITYTGNGSTDGPSVVSFATSTRPDIRTRYASDFKVTTNYRISEIDAAFNGTTTRKYLLGYGTGNNGKRSLLTSIQQQGYDDNGNLTSMPSTTFSYASSSTSFVSTNSVLGQAYVVADTNGDGINDVSHYTSGGQPEYWASSISANPWYSPVERGTRFIDVNSDGKADLIRGWEDDVAGTSTKAIWLDQASGFTSTTSWPGVVPIFAYNRPADILTGGLFGDVNGDGLPDYETSLSGLDNKGYLGNGVAWDATTQYFAPAKDFPTTVPTATASQLVDVNGDGLDDWVYSDGTNTYVLLNTGTGWQSSPSSQWTLATSTLYAEPGTNPTVYDDRGIRFLDINGDGLPDLVRAYQNTGVNCTGPEVADVKAVYLNPGNGWATSTAYSLPSYITSCGFDGNSSYKMLFNEYGNWTGNGQMNQDVLTSVTNSKGGTTNVTYTPTAQTGTNPNLPVSLLVVNQSVTNDGRGTIATTTYSYSGGSMYSSSGVRDRKFAGFSVATTTAPDAVTATYYDQGDTIDTSRGEQSDGYPQINHPFRKDVFDLSGNIKQRTYYRWDAYPHTNSNFVGLGEQLTEDFASDGSHRDKAITYQYSSTTDDVINTTQYGEVTGNSDGTFTDISGDTRTTNILYVASSTVDMTLPIEKTVFDNSAATSSDQKLYYDSLSFGQVTTGNNTRQEDWISGTRYASTTKIFNSYGLVATSTDRNGNATSYVYDAYRLFVATTSNPLLQKTQFLYNYTNGKVKQSTDPNNRLTKNLYDGAGRLTEVDQSNTTTPTVYATSTTYQYTDNTTTPSIIRRTDYLTAATTTDTYDFSDGLGRLIQERKSSQTAGVYAAFDKLYNAAGELSAQSLPYFSSGTSFTTATSLGNLYNYYLYDALQRVLTTGNVIGTTTNTYSKWTTTTTDPNSNIKDYVLDALAISRMSWSTDRQRPRQRTPTIR